MTGETLLGEGDRLARECFWLLPDGSDEELAAVWRGWGAVPAGADEHWLTIDYRFLPREIIPASSCLSVYTGRNGRGLATIEAACELRMAKTGTPLYAKTAKSLPPLEAVFRFGSAAVHQWLAQLGWSSECPYNDNFPDQHVTDVYLQAYQENCPLYRNDAYAVLGGWHFPWPDGDWEALLAQTLIGWTIADAEPWVEIWDNGNSFRVIERIT